MRIALIIFIGIHGCIHLFGFLKAFNISEFNAISQPISKSFGLLWFLTFLFFAISVILLLIHSDYWLFSGCLGIVLSQVLIFNYWSDAKFGTIANVIIILAIIIGYSNFSLKQKIKKERIVLFENSQLENQALVGKEVLENMPPIIQKWLINSNVIGKQPIANVYLTQEVQLKLKPEQEDWNNGKSEQYFTVEPPAFHWTIHTQMNSLLSVIGRDKFENGKGQMMIKLLSLFSVANVKNDEKVNEASLQRYLAEIVWFPTASLSPYIKWETIDDYAAKATMNYQGTTGSGIFHFDKTGNFKKFTTERYLNTNDAKPTQWTVISTKTEQINGLKIPTECEANWQLKNGKWTWLKLKITNIQYNLNEFPVVKNRP